MRDWTSLSLNALIYKNTRVKNELNLPILSVKQETMSAAESEATGTVAGAWRQSEYREAIPTGLELARDILLRFCMALHQGKKYMG